MPREFLVMAIVIMGLVAVGSTIMAVLSCILSSRRNQQWEDYWRKRDGEAQ